MKTRLWPHYLVRWLALRILVSVRVSNGDPVDPVELDPANSYRADRQERFWNFYYKWFDELSGQVVACLRCMAGEFVTKHCTERAPESTACGRCPNGTYTDAPNGLERCILCSRCSHHRYVAAPCKVDRNTRCRCQGRMYEDGDVCVHCFPGSERLESEDDGPCRRCPAGYFSFPSRGQDTCQPHTNCSALGQTLMRAGSSHADAACAPAPATAPPGTGSGAQNATRGSHSRSNSTPCSLLSVISTVEKSAPITRLLPDGDYKLHLNVIIGVGVIVLFVLVVIMLCLGWHKCECIHKKFTTAKLSRQEKDVYAHISENLGLQWKQLARELQCLSTADIETIETTQRVIQDKTHMVLMKWKQKKGDVATLRVLARVLSGMHRRDLVEFISSLDDECTGSNAMLI